MAGPVQLGGDGRSHFVGALRYVALNPVWARFVARAGDWTWSSTRALIAGEEDHVVRVALALERVGDFMAFLGEEFEEALTYAALRNDGERRTAGGIERVAGGYGGADGQGAGTGQTGSERERGRGQSHACRSLQCTMKKRAGLKPTLWKFGRGCLIGMYQILSNHRIFKCKLT